jgi:CheY-like chemotaxis protein
MEAAFARQPAARAPDRQALDDMLDVLSKGLDRMAEISSHIDEGPPTFEVQPADADGPRHVLVVDDSATMRQTVEVRLRQEGFEVCTAADGLEAHQLLRSRPFAAIVTDVEMPFLSGMKLVETCARSLPIVVMTSNPIPDDEVRALEWGAAAYLAKDPEIADRVVHSILKHLATGTPSPS